jgi:hypothetical protein
MKRCPTCKRAFDDDTLSFCLDDGTPLVRDSASRADSQETIVSPPPTMPTLVSGLPPTLPYNQLPGTINAARFTVPAAQGYEAATKERRTWLWVVAILAILFLVIAAVVIMAVVVPPMLRAANNDNRPQPTPTRTASTPTPSPSASAWDDMPGDEDEVKSQLTRVEEEWTEANVKGDKKALERILAKEYSGDPNSQTKREYIDGLEPDPSIKSWQLVDLTVNQDGTRATVKGTLKNVTEKGTKVYQFTDKFVWRDHRWQAVASKTTSVK